MTKAVLIDVENKEIKEVEYDGIKEIHKYLKCDVFTSVTIGRAENGDRMCVYVDDEGLLKGNTQGFRITGYGDILMGNGLVVVIDVMGESIDLKIPNIEVMQENVLFVDLNEAPPVPEPYVIEFDNFEDLFRMENQK